MRTLGAILAGGRSRRFGSDKAVALLDGVALIGRVIAALGPQVDALVVCGRTIDGYDCVADRPGPDLGPLGGLSAALHYARANGFDRVVSAPCDAPFLPVDLVARLAEPPCYVAAMPVIGLWPSSLSETLDRHLATADDRSMRSWAVIAGVRSVDLGALDNVNTPADLDQLASAVRSASSI
ncbi:molybdenum cofactor guanylyltransferase [Sphingomonas sp. SUN019]|uniref:molybdenum cofactor guanylyltransferase n=1 Tax=Sphingomonas sp. SUN019 TaxID=2937788 RepID=UPI0021642A25|nr:molybdenum cofactor guanylyltransferase [Sphingomonas sp. SUN019]UVO50314.1 molybdenum cofactor guanylyltransferase [Sphingomonas sp. SUN019]